jgi:hypothetical protein
MTTDYDRRDAARLSGSLDDVARRVEGANGGR